MTDTGHEQYTTGAGMTASPSRGAGRALGAPMTAALAAIAATLLLAATVLLMSAAPAQALVRDVDERELAQEATTIVIAEAAWVRSYRTADPQPLPGYGGGILTDVRLDVCQILKGDASSTLTITIPGGTLGLESVTSPDAPSFTQGGTYVVFLDEQEQIVAWRQGQPQVVAGEVPDLGDSVADVKETIARTTGQQAKVLAPLPPEARESAAETVSAASASGDDETVASEQVAEEESAAASTTRSTGPVITGITPSARAAGTSSVVTITGSGFGTSPGKVGFFYQDGSYLLSAPIRSWTATEIRCVVPIGTIDNYPASAGSGPVYVRTSAGAWSDGYSFSVKFGYGGIQWPRNRCAYYVAALGHTDWKSAVDAAAATWTAGSNGRFQFVDQGTTSSSNTDADDGRNVVSWGYGLPGDVIAAAWTSTIGRAILETDIMFNADYPWSTNGAARTMDVQTIALHELGHWLNLRDLYGSGDVDKVMYGYGDFGEMRRTLSEDDLAGVRWIYAAKRTDTKRPSRTYALRESVRRYRRVGLTLKVADPAFSCGAAKVTIVVRDRRGRRVARLVGRLVRTNKWVSVSWKPRLKKGTYRWHVYATDLAGHRQLRVGSNRLVIR